MKLIVGLGNPGPEYYLTRHNSGFTVIESIGTASGVHFSTKRDLFCELARAQLAGRDVLLVKPTTFMNLSGRAVGAILRWYKISSKDLLIVHDDVSLPLGRIRFQAGGGAGGQHGVESIIECLGGARDFDRLKFGCGPDPGGSVRADYVLSRYPLAQQDLLNKSLALASEAVIFWVRHGVADAMNKYNGIRLDLPPESQDQADTFPESSGV